MKYKRTAGSRLSWFVMPFQWIARGCWDWTAHKTAWSIMLSKLEPKP